MAIYEDDNIAQRPNIGAGAYQADPARDADLIRPIMDADEDEEDVDSDEDTDLDTDDDLDMDEQGDEDEDEELDEDLEDDDLEADEEDTFQTRTGDSGEGGINDGVGGPSQSMGASPNDASPGKLGGSMGGGFGSGA